MRRESALAIGILLLAGFVLGGFPAPVRAQSHFGISAGLYQPEEDDGEVDRTEVFGIFGGHRFHSNFGVEGSLSRVDLAEAFAGREGVPAIFNVDLQLDLYALDLSLQWFPRGGNFVVFGGPGAARLDADLTVTFFGQRLSASETLDLFTAHAGLGYEWEIHDRFFIRPEARVRRYFDDEIDKTVYRQALAISYQATDYQASVLFGWRFGS
jgi:hypothetical protein